MNFPAIIHHPVTQWLRRIVALLLAAAGLLMILFILGRLTIPSGDVPGTRERLESYRQLGVLVTDYLNKNGHLPDHATMGGLGAQAGLNERHELSVHSECTESDFAKMKGDRFVISDWGGEWAHCYASPSGKHTLILSAWEDYWSRTGSWRLEADMLAAGAILVSLAGLIWLRINLPPAADMVLTWLRRALALPVLLFAALLLAAGGYHFYFLTQDVAAAKALKRHFQDAAIIVTAYQDKHGRYPDRKVMQAWVERQRPVPFDNMSVSDDCGPGDKNVKERTDRFVLTISYSYDDACYAHPSGKTSFPTTIFPLLITLEGFETEMALLASCLTALFAWRLWPRRKTAEGKAHG